MMPHLENVTAMILAGGLGTRLRSIVADRPKVLATVCGKPFMAYLLDQVASAGIKRAVLCVGYCSKQIQAAFGETYDGVQLTYSQESAPPGTAGALRLAAPLIQSEAFIALNGDSFCQVNLRDLWVWHHAHKANVTLVLTRVPDTTRYGRVFLASDGAITGFEEKGSTAGAGWVNAGIYVLDSGMVWAIPQGRAVSLEHEVFPGWVGQRLYGYQSRGRFLDIGTPESYAQADAFFARRME